MLKSVLVVLFIIFCLPDLGAQEKEKHSLSCPKSCSSCEQVIQKGLQYLAKNYKEGMFSINLTAMMGLAFLASGSTPESGPYSKQLQEITEHLQTKEPSKEFMVWHYSFSGLYLLELLNKQPKNKDVQSLLQKVLAGLEETQWKGYKDKERDPAETGWGHHGHVPTEKEYKDKKGAYRTLNASTVLVMITLTYAKMYGHKISDDIFNGGLHYIKDSWEKEGALGYFNPKVKGYFSAVPEPPRTWGAVHLMKRLALLDEKTAESHWNEKKVLSYAKNALKNLIAKDHGKTAPAYALFLAMLGTRALGNEDWQTFKGHFWDKIIGAQEKDGSFIALVKKERRC